MKKHIYVVISRTNTKIGLAIRKVSGHDYNHVSIAMDDKLDEMYSFARYRNNSFLVGGFVRESILRYKNDEKPVKVKVYKVDLSEENYKEVVDFIEKIKENSSDYIYDTLGLVGIRRVGRKTKYRMHTCLSFACEVLRRAKVIEDKEIKSIRTLQYRLKKYPSFTRKLTSYHMENAKWHGDEFELKDGIFEKLKKSVRHMKKVIS